jgi:hypothetical protein
MTNNNQWQLESGGKHRLEVLIFDMQSYICHVLKNGDTSNVLLFMHHMWIIYWLIFIHLWLPYNTIKSKNVVTYCPCHFEKHFAFAYTIYMYHKIHDDNITWCSEKL